ncbi:hypothetical protein BH23ACT10_BH23ACT10_16530 [soil metagenome]
MDMTAVAAAGGLAQLATLNVSLWTIRVALAAAGRRLAAALVSGVEALLFALVFGAVVSGLDDPLRIGAYACGVTLGTLLGIVVGERLSTGQSVVTAVFDGSGWAQVTTLRDAGWPVTSSAGSQVLALAERTGSVWAQGWAHNALGHICVQAGAIDRAIVHARRSCRLFMQIEDDRGVAWALTGLAEATRAADDLAAARSAAVDAARRSAELGDVRSLAWALEILGAVATNDHPRHAALLAGAVAHLRDRDRRARPRHRTG